MASIYHPSLSALQSANAVSLQRYMVLTPTNYVATVGVFNGGLLHLYVSPDPETEQLNPASLVGAVTVVSIRET